MNQKSAATIFFVLIVASIFIRGPLIQSIHDSYQRSMANLFITNKTITEPVMLESFPELIVLKNVE